jgi:nucleotide-binding universal stress UspA family protein
MTKRVLVGTDGSPEAQVALRWAVRFCAATDAELTVVTAWRPSFTEIDPNTHDEQLAGARSILEDQWCAPVRGANVPYHAALLEGDPRDWLLVQADEMDADLVVVGVRGGGGSAHPVYLGSVTHHLVHHTDRPVAAIPPHARLSPPARIMVGVDGSAGSARAIQWCVDFGQVLGAEVVAVYAELPLAEWVRHDDPHSWYRHAQDDCETWSAPLRDAGVRSRTLVTEHEPVRGLSEAGIQEEADLLVVGARGRGGFSGLRLGRTALRVLHRSGIPTVVVPPARQ